MPPRPVGLLVGLGWIQALERLCDFCNSRAGMDITAHIAIGSSEDRCEEPYHFKDNSLPEVLERSKNMFCRQCTISL